MTTLDVTGNLEDYLRLANKMFPDIEELTLPLKRYFNIANFGYLKIFFDTRYIYICNDKALMNDYIKYVQETNIFFKTFIRSPNHEYKIILWPDTPSHYSMELYQQYNYWHGVSFMKTGDDFVELYWFSSTTCNSQIRDFFLQHTDVLYKYILYFQEKTRHTILQQPIQNLPLYQRGVDFSLIRKDYNHDEELKIAEFLNAIKLKSITVPLSQSDEVAISKRQIDCLQLMSQGLGAKEISNKLGVSHRTVEMHINNLKTKIGINYRSELIDFYSSKLKKFFT